MKKLLERKGRPFAFAKFDLKMKITIVLLFSAFFGLYASDGYSQRTKITLNIENTDLSKIIDEIEVTTEFRFVYDTRLLDLDRQVSLKVHRMNIHKVLELLFRDQNIEYLVRNKQIILKKPIVEKKSGHMAKTIPASTMVQQTSVSGIITDKDGVPLAGVSIVIVGQTRGTTSDFDGNYKIDVAAGEILEFTYIGMEAVQKTVDANSTINVVMNENAAQLNEVVIIGYGTRKKKDLTGSLSTISNDEITKEVKMTPELAIQGKMAGVFVSNTGADPTARPTVRIRGVSTLGYNDPLYVIDGIPITEGWASEQTPADGTRRGGVNIMNMINPDDIESMTVLKDASATAIYGVRASNGVILIETKRGKKGKTRVNFSSSYGIQSLPISYDVLETQEYVDLYNEAWDNNTTIAREDDPYGMLYDPSSAEYLGNNGSFTNDWVDNVIDNGAAIRDYNLSVSGGSDKSNFSMSLGYTSQESVIFSKKFERYNFSVNSDHQVTDWLKLGESFRAISTHTDTNSSISLADAIYINPWQPLYDPNNINGLDGYAIPARQVNGAILTRGYGNSTRTNFAGQVPYNTTNQKFKRNLATFYAEISPIAHFRVRGTLSVDYYISEGDTFSLPESQIFDFGANGVPSPNGSYIRNTTSSNNNIVKEFLVGYNNSFGKHSFDIIFNAMEQDYNTKRRVASSNIDALNYEDVYVPEGPPADIGTGERPKDWDLSEVNAGLLGYMGRLHYDFDGKYLLDVTVRRDASSKFAPGYKWGTFPAVGLAWRVSQEKFMENVTWLTDLKFRASWGQTGNQETRDFNYLSLVNQNPKYAFGNNPESPGQGYLANGTVLGDFPIIDTSWETVTSTNVGIDATFLNSKFSLSADYYLRNTEDILQAIDIPVIIGALTSPVVNLATVQNKGFEFQLGYNDTFGQVNFNSSLNFTTVKNEVTKLYRNTPQDGGGGRVEVGYPIGYIYGYKSDGILQNQTEVDEYTEAVNDPGNNALIAPGDYRFQDLYGEPDENNPDEFAYRKEGADGTLNGLDQTYLGKTIPGYYYGFSLGADYKGLDMSLTFRGTGDVQKINNYRWAGEAVGIGGVNFLTSVRDRWTPQNPSTTQPRAIAGDPSGNNRFSDRWVEDADFLRLQNMQIGYSFNRDVLDAIGASNLRLYSSFSNVFVITKYDGLDPENDTTPFVVTMGFNIGF